MQMRAFDPEKCGSAGSGKKTERVEKGNACSPMAIGCPLDATGIYLDVSENVV